MIPGAALRKLSAMTGLKATKEGEGCYRLDVGENQAYFSFLDDEKEACAVLRELNLKRVNNIVFEHQGWRCKLCGDYRSLQGHHVIYRSRWRPSMGPLDCEANIIGVCAGCHEAEHN